MGTKLRGTAPLTLELVEGTPVIVRARAPGHAELSKQVTPKAKNDGLKLRLLPLQYLIEVVTTPPGASINVGGRRATTPAEIRLPDVPESETPISVRLAGYAVTRTRVLPSQFVEQDGAMRAVVDITLEKQGGGREAKEPTASPRRPPREPRAGEQAQPDAPKDEPAAASPKPEPAPEPKAEEERPVRAAPARAPKEEIPDNPFGD